MTLQSKLLTLIKHNAPSPLLLWSWTGLLFLLRPKEVLDISSQGILFPAQACELINYENDFKEEARLPNPRKLTCTDVAQKLLCHIFWFPGGTCGISLRRRGRDKERSKGRGEHSAVGNNRHNHRSKVHIVVPEHQPEPAIPPRYQNRTLWLLCTR